ncbi:MAG: hypothetical protein ACLP3Q_24485 [Streptosporangiaceae bacterium]
MPFPYQSPARPMARREKRMLAAAAAVIVAVFAAVGIYAAVRPGSYGPSHDGCVTVQMPSSTGGALLHDCGAAARAMCRNAFANTDKLSLLTRPQCRLAGLGPPH